jgi:hypothetical protein
MKKRIEIVADSVSGTTEGVELRKDDALMARVFIRNGLPHAWVSGIAEPMAIRAVSIQDELHWILIDFNEHDEIHRAAIRLDEIDWDWVDLLLEAYFRDGKIPFHRRKATQTKEAEQVVAPNRSLSPTLNSTSSVRGSEDF